MFDFKATRKGHLKGHFLDRFGAECSVQESSYPDEPCIWLGIETDSGGDGVPTGRMHINQKTAQEIIEVLRDFVNEGALGVYSPEDFSVGQWVRGVGKENFDVKGRVVEHNHEKIVIQDQSAHGSAGRYVCLWEQIHKLWEPATPPPDGVSLYQHILEED